MALVTIVYALDKTGHGPDLDRIGTVEDMEPDLARMWLDSGVARVPSDEELAAHNDKQAAAQEAEREDLSKLLKADLEAKASGLGVDVPDKATKADLIAAIEDHRAQQTDTVNADSAAEPGSSAQPMVVTTMPGVGGPTSSEAGSPTAADPA